MLVSIHHHEVGIPQVCFASTKRAARMRTQLISKRLSSQRFLSLVISRLSMPCSIPAASLPFSTLRVSRGHRHLRMEDCRGSEPICLARFLLHVANIPRTTKAKGSIGVPSGGQHNDQFERRSDWWYGLTLNENPSFSDIACGSDTAVPVSIRCLPLEPNPASDQVPSTLSPVVWVGVPGRILTRHSHVVLMLLLKLKSRPLRERSQEREQPTARLLSHCLVLRYTSIGKFVS